MKTIRILFAALFIVALGSMTIVKSGSNEQDTTIQAVEEPQSQIYDRVNDRMDPTRDYGGPAN